MITPLETIKKFINDNCFTKSGGLNNRVCLESWWINRDRLDIYNAIMAFDVPSETFSERIYNILNDNITQPSCQVCGSQVNFMSYSEGYRTYCSKYCMTQSKDRNEKISKNRDMGAITEKVKQTNLKRYGVEYFFKTKDFITKSSNTKLALYGDINYNNLEQAKKTNLERYGVEFTSQSKEVIEKIQAKKTENCPKLRNKDWLLEQNKTKSITEIAKELNVAYRTVYLWFIKHDIEMNFYSSSYTEQQNEMVNYIKSICSLDVIVNDRNAIKPKEIDIYIPELKLGFEFNGMYWHSEDEKRHLEKLNLCTAKGIRLIQFWDTEWITKKDIVKSMISTTLNQNQILYARKCDVKEVSSSDYNNFVDDNHIQGRVNSSIRVGLYHHNELVSVIGIGKSRFSKNNSHELLRFCNKKFTNVVGGFSKLLKFVDQKYTDIESLESFCDIRLFTGELYEKNDFTLSHQTTPGFVYYKSGKVVNRQTMQKHKMKSILTDFNSELSEHRNANNNGWLRVWDCGQKLYCLKAKRESP
jgi:very-short-patch-repair endonuclease